MLSLRFVLILYHLVDVPLRYLLPDPAQLPVESLRFFVVDASWIDARHVGAAWSSALSNIFSFELVLGKAPALRCGGLRKVKS